MPTGTFTSTIAIGGVSIGSEATRTGTTAIEDQQSLPAGKTGTLTTRTDDDTGVATLGAGHGITTDDYVDVYWAGGVRYGMDVTAVDGNDVTIDVGAGDVLPAQSTALVVTPRVEIDIDFDGDLVQMIAVLCTKRGHIEFLTNADVSIKAKELTANEAWSWIAGQGITNPLTGDPVGKIQATCGEAATATLKTGVLYNSS
jgi:hypothetical protein